MGNILGISAGYHDAGVSVVDANNGEILFASHSERFSKKKHDKDLCPEILEYAKMHGHIGTVAYYEKPFLKKLRMLRAGQKDENSKWTLKGELKQHFVSDPHILESAKLKSYNHHKSHAAAGFQTSPYNEATVVVIDAIGEMDTITIWKAHYDKNGFAKYKKLWSQGYPDSIGLFYSAVTGSVGLRPMDEEYILMGMAAYGSPRQSIKKIRRELISSLKPPKFKDNLHVGIESLEDERINEYDVAAGAQFLVEEMIEGIMEKSKQYDSTNNLVFMGGVALNCSANRWLGQFYENIWIMPNPGDAGSSLGAAALAYGKKLKWNDAFLGYNISGGYPVVQVVEELQKSQIAGVASGKAEFGPRALGNRSLLADPRGEEIKDKVNEIKKRQKFRPFAPIILEEYVNVHFKMPSGFEVSPYMQVTAQCLAPDTFPAIVHHDGTSRVQTVPKDGSGIRLLLEWWYKETGCPMLLNTSLNVRGEPIVNDIDDAHRFENKYKIRVFS